GEISEGHTRPLLMLADRPQEQATLFKEITTQRLTVRDAEQVARRIATDKARKGDLTPELLSLERELTEKLGTRWRIEKKDQGGKVTIDFFSVDDLANIRAVISQQQKNAAPAAPAIAAEAPAAEAVGEMIETPTVSPVLAATPDDPGAVELEDDL